MARKPRDADDDRPRQKRVHYNVGTECWFIDNTGHWFLCTVVANGKANRGWICIKPVTGRDADREIDWPYGGELEFPGPSRPHPSPLCERLRPLSARTP